MTTPAQALSGCGSADDHSRLRRLEWPRVRLWKIELQRFADETGLVLNVHHYPPGTSKWNRIEHRLFCHIPQTWRGRPHGLHGCRRADRSDDNQGRPENRERAGHARFRKGHQGQRCPDEALDIKAIRSIPNGTTPSAREQLRAAFVGYQSALPEFDEPTTNCSFKVVPKVRRLLNKGSGRGTERSGDVEHLPRFVVRV